MWGRFVAEFRAAPIPQEWKKNGPHPLIPDLTWEDIRGNYYAALDEASEAQKLQAKGAFKTCLDLSVKHQYFDEFSRSCEVWLSKNYAQRVPPHRRVPRLALTPELGALRSSCAAEPRRHALSRRLARAPAGG
jgi:hypothetical protein